MVRWIPWVIGVIVLAFAINTWLESRNEGPLARAVDRVRYGDEGTLERTGREIDEAIDEFVEELRDD
jgi:hypothetical protein